MAIAQVRRPFLIVFGLMAAASAISGCKGGGDVAPVGAPDQLYQQAAHDLKANNYKAAIEVLESLESHYPFTNAAKQGQLDLMFAYYKNKESESAIDQADQFVRENPTHPRVDYAYYIKGLVYFDSGGGWLEETLRADVTKRPPHESQKALQAFLTLLQRYPKSPYAADARQRAVFLRNRLADYELSVARYYVKREAYVAAVNRARAVIENYDGSPAAIEALGIMSAGYQALGIEPLAKVADQVRAANTPAGDPNEGKANDHPWWRIWDRD
jgi:outer membrane protein assembly factor BamD